MQSNIQRHKRTIIEVKQSKEECMQQIKWKKKKSKNLVLKHKRIYPSIFSSRQTINININIDIPNFDLYLYGEYSYIDNNRSFQERVSVDAS
jgi:hypothetical protein